MSTNEDARTGLQARLIGDAPLTALLALDAQTGEPSILEGLPDDLIDPEAPEAAYPRLTWTPQVERPINPPVYTIPIALNAWAHDNDPDALDAIHPHLERLLDAVAWRQNGTRLYSQIDGISGYPATEGSPRRRLYLLTLIVSL